MQRFSSMKKRENMQKFKENRETLDNFENDLQTDGQNNVKIRRAYVI